MSPDPARAGTGATSVVWVIGLVLYGLEVAVVGYISLVFGGLSAMLSDTCYTDSTELICRPNWQTAMAMTALTALLATVLVAVALMAWRRRLAWLIAAAVATPVVPLVAFLVMQEVVTA